MSTATSFLQDVFWGTDYTDFTVLRNQLIKNRVNLCNPCLKHIPFLDSQTAEFAKELVDIGKSK